MSNTTRTSTATRTTAVHLSLSALMSKYFRNLFADEYGNLAQVIGSETKTSFFRDGQYVDGMARSFTVEINYADGTFKETRPMPFNIVREYLANNGFYNAKVPA